MDDSITSIVLLIVAIFVFLGIISIALFVSSDDFEEFMEAEEPIELEEVEVIEVSENATAEAIGALSWKRSTIKRMLGAMGFETENTDDIYESKALVYSVTKLITVYLVMMGAGVGVVSLFIMLRQQMKGE